MDKADDNRIRFTVQIHVPSSKKDSNESLGSTSILWADGVNTADALSKLQIKSPRKLFFGQMYVFIINEKFAKENGVRDQLDFLARVPDTRLRNKLFISEDSVDQILSSKTELEKSSVETLSGISKKLVVPAIDLNYFLQMQEDKGQSAVIPKIRMMEPDQKASNSMTPAIVGTSILKKIA
ncbi:Ger(x)C family spore germination protein [Paenibacillus farraposensis]